MLPQLLRLDLLTSALGLQNKLCAAECSRCCALAAREGQRDALAACAARRWLARNAAGVKHICCHNKAPASLAFLVSCLPALQDITLSIMRPLIKDDLGCLLQALAWCPRLRALDLSTGQEHTLDVADEYLCWPFPDAAAFAKLHSLTKLALWFDKNDHFCLADMVSALAPLTGLSELTLWLDQPDVLPAALAQLKGLRSLTLKYFEHLSFEAGCLDLPDLLSLKFMYCCFEENGQMLLGVTALQRLTCIEFTNDHDQKMPVFDPQLVQLPRLQRLVFSPEYLCRVVYDGVSPGLFSLPADMGALKASLLHLQISFLGLPRFPLALTQLVALESLDATENHCAELPAGITALSRLKELRLGRLRGHSNPLQLPLDVRALGDLSGFPALRKLTLKDCQAMLCPSLVGAVWHASLATLCFYTASPTPECAPVVLRLSRELRRLGRGSVIRCVCESDFWAVQADPGKAACLKFEADMNAYGQ